MAKQKGHVKYQGTIGDIRHFKIKGMDGYFAGLKGGPTANQIKTAPEFERTRENMSEFGGCAHVAKVLRSGLGRELSKFTDPSFTGRLTALMKTVNLKDTTGVRGKRAINVSLHKASLKNIVFKKGVSFESICNLRSEEHTSELQSRENLVCRLLLEKKKKNIKTSNNIIQKTHKVTYHTRDL